MKAMTPSFFTYRSVVFVVDPSLGIEPKAYVEVGRVEQVDEAEKRVFVSFMYHGYKSTVEWVPFSHLLAVFDKDEGSHVELYRFSGYGFDLRGLWPYGQHEFAKRT